jgi:hypothetical protein
VEEKRFHWNRGFQRLLKTSIMMLWTDWKNMFSLLRKTSLYLLAIPFLTLCLGTISNQVVLWANHDRFPVLWNDYKVAQYDLSLHRIVATANPIKDADIVEQAKFDIDALEHEGFIDDTHCVMTSKTHLNALADIVDFKEATYSVGDGLIYLGEWLGSFSIFLFVFDVFRKLKNA